jgi:hypothetical protein
MKTLSAIQQQFAAGQFEFSRHAFRRVVERDITEQEIREAGVKAEGSRIIPRTSIRRARCCWVSRRMDGHCIFKYRLPMRP